MEEEKVVEEKLVVEEQLVVEEKVLGEKQEQELVPEKLLLIGKL